MKLNGSVVFSADATELLQPSDPDASLLSRVVPYVSSVAMNEEMSLQLDQRNARQEERERTLYICAQSPAFV